MENSVAVGFLSVPSIILLIELFKRIVPGLSGRVWLTTSFVFGVAAQVLSAVALELPVDFAGWLTLVGLGLVNGLAASKAYDELIDKGAG